MTEHDKFCRYHSPEDCVCEVIAAIRDDERESIVKQFETIHYPIEMYNSNGDDAIVCASCWDGEYRYDLYPCQTLRIARGESIDIINKI